MILKTEMDALDIEMRKIKLKIEIMIYKNSANEVPTGCSFVFLLTKKSRLFMSQISLC